MAEMRKLTAYFSQLNGESQWDANAERIFDDLFHEDVVIVGAKKKFDYRGWKDWYKQSIEDGLIFEMEKVVKTGPNTIVYSLKVRDVDGTALDHTAKAVFQDGKLIRTEAVNPNVYDIMAKKKGRKPIVIL